MQDISPGRDGRMRSEAEREGAVVAFCGWSGAGKTTLLEAVIPRLTARGISVAVVKHDAHGVRLDTPGKDSDRLFRAGATVFLRGPDEGAKRFHSTEAPALESAVADLQARHDLILVEGHKDIPLPKVWLEHKDRRGLPPNVGNVLAELPWDADRVGKAEELVMARLQSTFHRRTVLAGILVGGRSRRMGFPKQMIELEGAPLAVRIAASLEQFADDVVLLGDGEAPASLAGLARLPDARDSDGPMAGLLSALRWAPFATWVIASCDLPRVNANAVQWLVGQRRPGRWAVMPTLGGLPEPLLATYEPQARALLEELNSSGERAPWQASRHAKVATPQLPADLADCWLNANTPAELELLSGGAQ